MAQHCLFFMGTFGTFYKCLTFLEEMNRHHICCTFVPNYYYVCIQTISPENFNITFGSPKIKCYPGALQTELYLQLNDRIWLYSQNTLVIMYSV